MSTVHNDFGVVCLTHPGRQTMRKPTTMEKLFWVKGFYVTSSPGSRDFTLVNDRIIIIIISEKRVWMEVKNMPWTFQDEQERIIFQDWWAI